MKNWIKCVALGLVAVCGAAQAEVRMQGAGSTFVAPIMQRWTTEYQSAHPEVKIDYQSIGSGGGVKGITEKTLDFGASDAPMSKKEIEKAGGGILNIPVIAGAVVAGYNLPGVAGDVKLDGETLADIYQNKITKWNDAKIAALNPGVNLPDLAITPVHRTDGSGTTYIFTNYLATQSADFKEKVGAAKQVEWPGGQGGKGSEGVTQVVQGTPGAIGYFELAYANQNKLAYAMMKNKDGNFVKATPDSTSLAGEAAAKEMKSDSLVVPLWNQPGKDVYPICGLVYALVYRDLGYVKDEAKAKALVDFLQWATHDGQKMASSLDYAPLNEAVQKKVAEALGTLTWSGQQVKPVAAAN
jgi:phosphate transport system substrate-binding protein